MNEIREQLERAYRYIKHDRTAEAEQILRSLLDEDSENVHAWWLLAHAQTDTDEIRHALNRVLALDPGYPNARKARELLDALESHFPTPADLDALTRGLEAFIEASKLVARIDPDLARRAWAGEAE